VWADVILVISWIVNPYCLVHFKIVLTGLKYKKLSKKLILFKYIPVLTNDCYI